MKILVCDPISPKGNPLLQRRSEFQVEVLPKRLSESELLPLVAGVVKGGAMGLNRRVSFYQGLKYKGRGPMLHWILHRVNGLAILLFVGLHVTASFFMQQTGAELATAINILYESWVFQIVVAFIVLFHALNGLRIALLDFWPKFLEYQKEITLAQWLIFIPLFSMTALIMLMIHFSGG